MFIPLKKIQEIVEFAYSDVWDFLNEILNDPTYFRHWPKAHWLNAQSYVKQLDGKSPAASVSDVCHFIEPFLEWIEQRRVKNFDPWIIQTNQRKLSSDSSCFYFLEFLYHILGSLIEPGHRDKLIYGRNISDNLKRLGELVAFNNLENKDWKISFVPKTNEIELYGFASWLIVYEDDRWLHIVYDREQIEESTSGSNAVAKRLEKIFLHEIGHARTNLPHYLGWTSEGNVIRAAPIHETLAWHYSYTIRSCISSARSRISRLLGEYDNEWK